jgi:YgiT-type zinc finger domain-containing protein
VYRNETSLTISNEGIASMSFLTRFHRFRESKRSRPWPAMNRYADSTYCGGEVVEQTIEYDYWLQKHLMIVSNVPADVCRQCGEKYFKPDILKRMDSLYHGIFERHEKPQRTLTIPAVSL